uniref:Uncharacterized protein n=1 Tax=Strombidium rassoulzadegani TaxID=1082188 RepID=A0A7S3FV33_9SPIT|mmetsp:Transcript_3694/g.6289  ORF Transcript_3694/g.6289 Transcript_3694/m.6289 type:complete len:104 (+) Transcript_3694:221-532(+)
MQVSEQIAQIKYLIGGKNNEGGAQSAAPSSGNVKALQSKIKHYEKMIGQSEKERTELKTRVTMAETQNKALLKHLSDQAQQFQKEKSDLKIILAQKGVDTSRL